MMATQSGAPKLNASLVHQTLNAYQQTAALRAAIELDIFTAIGKGFDTPETLAKRCSATERGIRILCDYLVILGFLTKKEFRYSLTLESAAFLDRRSSKYQGATAAFLTLPETIDAFMQLAQTIRTGRPAMKEGEGSIAYENPIWVEFARSMGRTMLPIADEIARVLNADAGTKWRVLDIAAGHGNFGITLAKHNPNAEIFAQDWGPVLEVAAENARTAGIESRFRRVPGNVFEVDLGSGYDVVMITGFLHHFDIATNESLLRKVHAALAPKGIAATLDFVPNDDRVTPPRAASFSMTMLGMTPGGDAYTFAEYEQMFRNAGFSSSELLPRLPSDHSLIISRA
jgi:SAM-dependent methyltransferase